jgi:hypothetical protein
MTTATAVSAHIAYDLIEDTNHQVVIIKFLSHDITSRAHALELGEQLDSMIRPRPLQYFVIDCAGVLTLGNMAFAEIVSFARKASLVWVCNLDDRLRLGASLVGLDDCANFAASRRAAIDEAERTAQTAGEETADYPCRTG